MWQREWHNLVANFGTKQCKWHDHDMTRWPNVESICNKSEMHTYSKEIQIWFQEILHIWSLEIQQHLSQDLAVRQSRPCRDVSWFWFLPQEVGRVQAHSWLQVQVHDEHYSAKMIPFITRPRFRAGRLVFSTRRTCLQASPTLQVAFYLAGEITQVKESIPWVRCASGNVFDEN